MHDHGTPVVLATVEANGPALVVVGGGDHLVAGHRALLKPGVCVSLVMAYIVMAYLVTAYIVMAYIVMAYILIAYLVGINSLLVTARC